MTLNALFSKITLLLLLAFGAMDRVTATAVDTLQSVRGVVHDIDTGRPVSGAAIELMEAGTTTRANADGRFEISVPGPGTYRLLITATSYEVLQIRHRHPHDGELILQLRPYRMEAEDVVVTASPLGGAIRYQPAQAIQREEIEAQMRVSVGDLLEQNAGVHMRSFGQAPARPVIRGLDGERILMLENGERTGDFSATSADHAVSMDPMAVDRVEIVRGPASLLYGSNALGGVVNLFTAEQPRNWSLGFRGGLTGQGASVNRMGAGLARLGYGSDRWAISGSGLVRSAGDNRTPDGRLPDTWLQSTRFGTGIGYQDSGVESGFSLSTMDKSYGIPEEIDDPDESLEIRSRRHAFRSASRMEIDNGWIESLELRLHGEYNRLDDMELEREPDGTVEEELEKRLEQWSTGGTLRIRHQPAGRFSGVIGLNATYRDLQISGEEILAPNARAATMAAFLYEEMELARTATLQAGARLEHTRLSIRENEMFSGPALPGPDRRNDTVFSGSVGLNVRPAGKWVLGMQLARAFRTPSLEELYSDAPHYHVGAYEIGDPGLSNEQSLGGDLFVRYGGPIVRFEASGYLNRIDNFIVYEATEETDGASGLPVYRYSAADARLIGFEAIVDIQLSERLLATFLGDYTRGDRLEQGVAEPLPFMPPLRFITGITYTGESWWFGPKVTVAGNQERIAQGEEQTSGYLLLDFHAGYRIADGLRILIRMDNLLDTRYRNHLTRVEDRHYPMPGRNFNSVVRWEF